jgi:fructose-1,6-bisphosphatase/inositol monophosphatase family enzyme
MMYLPFAYSAAVIFNDIRVVEIRYFGAYSLEMCDVAGGDWTDLW